MSLTKSPKLTGKKVAAARVTRAAAPPKPRSLTDQVDELAEVLRRHDLSEIEVEQEGMRLYLRRGGEPVIAAAAPAPVSVPVPHHAPPAAPAPAPVSGSVDTSDGNVSYITSPFVGTFYRSPSPESAAFVDIGTHVRKGQVLCIVEAMKLMNEIESEIDGTVVQILVDNGQVVEYGEPLFKIKQG
jgi:acetyl-CoA carboxylase biotin carboxyl carrier protein